MPSKHYILRINREWGLSLGQYIKASVWDFPVMTERTRLISYLLYGLFSAILKKNTVKTPEVIFLIRLRALRLSSSLILKKYLMLVFLSVIENIVVPLSIFSVVFAHAHVCFTHNLKEPSSPEKISYCPAITKKQCTLSSQSEGAYYCSHIIILDNGRP